PAPSPLLGGPWPGGRRGQRGRPPRWPVGTDPPGWAGDRPASARWPRPGQLRPRPRGRDRGADVSGAGPGRPAPAQAQRRPAWSQGSRGSGHPARPCRPRRRRDGPAGRPGPLRPALAAAMTGSDAAASYQTLRGHLAYLKLTRAEELLAAHLEAARAQQLSHVAFLEALLGEEVT